jgi:uncharacterized protein
MIERVPELIRTLALAPHPEGGAFREVFKSRALSTIYFLLAADQRSRWHRVAHDEAWHFYEGDPLELFCLAPGLLEIERRILSPLAGPGEPVAVVPAGFWQAARTTGGHALVGCTVGPAFEFEDFRLMSDEPEVAAAMKARFGDLASLL